MAMLNWGRHNAQCLPVWKQSGPMLGAGCAHVGPSCAHIELSWAHRAYVGPSRGPCWAIGPILGLYWPLCWAHLGSMLGLCWDYVGLCWAYVAHVGPSWELCWGHVWAIYAETILRFKMSIFPPRARNLASRWAQYSFKTPQPCCANIDLRRAQPPPQQQQHFLLAVLKNIFFFTVFRALRRRWPRILSWRCSKTLVFTWFWAPGGGPGRNNWHLKIVST